MSGAKSRWRRPLPRPKPCAPAAKKSGKVAALGYNYIQSPAIRHIRALLDEKIIGDVNHLRIEMDEDFMADPEALFFWKHEAASGYGALDDFAVHPLSLVSTLFGRVARVMCDMAKPYADRRSQAAGAARSRPTTSPACSCIWKTALPARCWSTARPGAARAASPSRSSARRARSCSTRSASTNSSSTSPPTARPSKAIAPSWSAPHHKPYDRFIPAPGHGLGFNDLKIIECRELIARLSGQPAHLIEFDEGLEIERTVHAMARSYEEQAWVDVR